MHDTNEQAKAETEPTGTPDLDAYTLISGRKLALRLNCSPHTAIKYARLAKCKEVRGAHENKLRFKVNEAMIASMIEELKKSRSAQGKAGSPKKRSTLKVNTAPDTPKLWELF